MEKEVLLMATSFEVVYDRALTTIVDYKLDALAQSDYNNFLLYLQGILMRAIPDFNECFTDLSYDVTLETPSFTNNLSNKEINILAEIMVYDWFSGKINDVTQFQGHLNNKEFKVHSEAQNLKEKSEYLDRLREKYRQDITDYQLINISNISYFNV